VNQEWRGALNGNGEVVVVAVMLNLQVTATTVVSGESFEARVRV